MKSILNLKTRFPNEDPNCQFILDTDASGIGIGAVLSQVQDGNEKPISYASQSQQNYCTTKKRITSFIKNYKHFLLGRKFVVRTDQAPLKWIKKFKKP